MHYATVLCTSADMHRVTCNQYPILWMDCFGQADEQRRKANEGGRCGGTRQDSRHEG